VLAKHTKSFNLIDTLSVGVEEADDMPALSESEQVEWTAQFMTFRICGAITPKNQRLPATVDL
jgi:hypothetical protein